MKRLIFSAALLSCIACSQQPTAIDTFWQLDVTDFGNGESVDMSELFDDEQLIFLETTEKSLIGGSITTIRLKNDRIYILDDNRVIVFDNEGHHVGSIDRKGQGPEEYTGISNFDVDDEGNVVVVPMNHKVLRVYDVNGNFVRKIETPLNSASIKYIGDQDPLLYHQTASNTSNDSLKTVVSKLDHATGELTPCKTGGCGGVRDWMYIFGGGAFISKSNYSGNVYMSQTMCDTIFKMRDGQFEPFIYINFDGKNFPYSQYGKKNIGEFINDIQKSESPMGCIDFHETPTRYSLFYSNETKPHLLCFSKDGKEIKNYTEIKNSTFLEGMPIPNMDRSLLIDGDNAIFFVHDYEIEAYANCLKADKKNELLKRLRCGEDEQNPVLIVSKMK